jgi:hypothetical protein
MGVTEVSAVYANVGLNVSDELLRKHSLPGGQSNEDSIRLSREMLATLTGPAFKIVATTPEQQNVAKGKPTVWSWNIEATQEGEQYLEATLYALSCNVPGRTEQSSKNSKANRIETGERSGGIGEICSVEVDEK